MVPEVESHLLRVTVSKSGPGGSFGVASANETCKSFGHNAGDSRRVSPTPTKVYISLAFYESGKCYETSFG